MKISKPLALLILLWSQECLSKNPPCYVCFDGGQSTITLPSTIVPLPAFTGFEEASCDQIRMVAEDLLMLSPTQCQFLNRDDFRLLCGCENALTSPVTSTSVIQPSKAPQAAPVPKSQPAPVPKSQPAPMPIPQPIPQPVPQPVPVATSVTSQPLVKPTTIEPPSAAPIVPSIMVPPTHDQHPVVPKPTTISKTPVELPSTPNTPLVPQQQPTPPNDVPVKRSPTSQPQAGPTQQQPAAVQPQENANAQNPPCHVCFDGGQSTITLPSTIVPLPAFTGFEQATCEQIRMVAEDLLALSPTQCQFLNRDDFRVLCGCENALASLETAPPAIQPSIAPQAAPVPKSQPAPMPTPQPIPQPVPQPVPVSDQPVATSSTSQPLMTATTIEPPSAAPVVPPMMVSPTHDQHPVIRSPTLPPQSGPTQQEPAAVQPGLIAPTQDNANAPASQPVIDNDVESSTNVTDSSQQAEVPVPPTPPQPVPFSQPVMSLLNETTAMPSGMPYSIAQTNNLTAEPTSTLKRTTNGTSAPSTFPSVQSSQTPTAIQTATVTIQPSKADPMQMTTFPPTTLDHLRTATSSSQIKHRISTFLLFLLFGCML